VKFLFDQNLSHRLVVRLAKEFPGSVHVRDVGLERAPDPVVWDHAKANGFVIASKDSEFHQLSFLFGPPPKVVWIRRGNCSTATIESILRERREEILAFENSEEGAFLALL
jgi:predicted nuclease of predicted toxin-antitoxin system